MNWFKRKKPQDSQPSPTPRATPEPEPLTIPEVTPREVHEAMANGEALVFLDVRQPWDHDLQRPAGAQPLPLNELPSRMDELDRDARIVLSCYHGYTSLQGAAFLMQNGFGNVQSMSGGFAGWAEANLPIEGRGAPHRPS